MKSRYEKKREIREERKENLPKEMGIKRYKRAETKYDQKDK